MLTHWHPPPSIISSLKIGTVHLWRTQLDQQHANAALLSNDEKARAARFKFPLHQQRFINARSTLRCILTRYLNQAPEKLSFAYTAHGKPYLANHPSLFFNLSHSNQWALYAITLEEKIGVDIEYLLKEIDGEVLATRFFSSYESKLLHEISADKKQTAFFRLWTCKEAFIKAVGEGLSFPLKDFEIDITEKAPRLLSICGDEKAAQVWSLCQIMVAENYISAVALAGKINSLELWDEFHF